MTDTPDPGLRELLAAAIHEDAGPCQGHAANGIGYCEQFADRYLATPSGQVLVQRLAAAEARVGVLEKRAVEDERAVMELIDQRDHAEEMADMLASALAPEDIIGEHSTGNDPWQNALDNGCEACNGLAARAATSGGDQ